MKSPVPIFQDEKEMQQLIKRLHTIKPQRILEVGSLYGGTLWTWMNEFCGTTVVSVDMIADNAEHPKENVLECRKHWERWAIELVCLLRYYVGPSDHPEILKAVRKHAPYDFIFVDAGHKYHEVEADYRNYWPMLRDGGLLAFHDIAYPDGNPDNYNVGRVWREVREKGRWMEIIREHNPEGIWGIGVMYKE